MAANPELVTYIRLQQGLSTPIPTIRQRAAISGFSEQEIDEAFAEIGVNGSAPGAMPPPPPPTPKSTPELSVPAYVGATPVGAAPSVNTITPAATPAPPPPPYAMPIPTITPENSSGMGSAGEVPLEIRHWSWGAFGFTWIWGLFNGTFIALLCLIPVVGLIMKFVLGFKGNEWAWRNKRWESVDHFRRVQHNWAIAFAISVLITFGVIALFFASMAGLISQKSDARVQLRDSMRVTDIHSLQTDLLLYQAQYGTYPSSLDQLSPQFTAGQPVPTDPATNAPFQYQALNNGTSYKLCATMENANVTPPTTKTSTFENGQYCANSS